MTRWSPSEVIFTHFLLSDERCCVRVQEVGVGVAQRCECGSMVKFVNFASVV